MTWSFFATPSPAVILIPEATPSTGAEKCPWWQEHLHPSVHLGDVRSRPQRVFLPVPDQKDSLRALGRELQECASCVCLDALRDLR